MKKYKRALSLLLIICIMCCAVFGSVEFSNALVLNPWTIAICGTLLTAAGLSFSSSSDMESAVSSFWPEIPDLVKDDLQSKAAEFESSNDNDFFLTLGADIIAAISGWLSGVTASEGGSVVVPSGTTNLDISSLTAEYTTVATYPIDYFICNSTPSWDDFFFPTDLTVGFCLYPTGYNSNYHCYYARSDSNVTNNINLWRTERLTSSTVELRVKKDSSSMLTFGLYESSWGGIVVFCPYSVSGSLPSSIGVKGLSTSIPFSDVWAPGSSDEEKALVAGTDVVVPGGLVNSDGVLVSDVIVGMSAANVRANSGVNTDVVAGTGTITGTGEGTGIFEGIGNLVLNIPLVGTIASTLSEILEAIKGFFDVSRFDLNFESLKVGLTEVFPFCIPFDFYNAIKMFSSDASSFVFDINLETEYFTIDHTVDLTPFRLPILFFRYVVVFWFGFILISRTKDFMKW